MKNYPPRFWQKTWVSIGLTTVIAPVAIFLMVPLTVADSAIGEVVDSGAFKYVLVAACAIPAVVIWLLISGIGRAIIQDSQTISPVAFAVLNTIAGTIGTALSIGAWKHVSDGFAGKDSPFGREGYLSVAFTALVIAIVSYLVSRYRNHSSRKFPQ